MPKEDGKPEITRAQPPRWVFYLCPIPVIGHPESFIESALNDRKAIGFAVASRQRGSGNDISR
jgi:hypothetical protein